MKRIVRKWPNAIQDLIDHYTYIARDKIDPADRFLAMAEDAFQQLAEMPGMGRAWESPHPRLAGVRVYPMPGRFRNYLIFYRLVTNGIEVLAVLHGAHDLEKAMQTVLKASASES
jgi:toxin ParE1/3/4